MEAERIQLEERTKVRACLMLLSPDPGCYSGIQIIESYPIATELMNVLSSNIFFELVQPSKLRKREKQL